jgi:alpha-1,3-rhamnosyl/mannosyltransferase
VTPFGTPSWAARRAVIPTERPAEAPFLFVGTLEPRKNLERLLLAYRTFLREREAHGDPAPGLTLVGGRGWQDSRLNEILRPLAEAGRVQVLDYCGPEELWRQYLLARALLFPSLHEGFGFPILEAMAAGLPVLTSDRGAMAEVAGQAALLVDPHDEGAIVAAMHRLTDEKDLNRRLAGLGSKRWIDWSWETTAAATVTAYQNVLGVSS